MKIVIVKQTQKWGERYYAYTSGLLTWLGIFCMFNRVGFSGGGTPEECIKNVTHELQPNPPKNSKIVDIVDIKL